jgi:hypothetical protein
LEIPHRPDHAQAADQSYWVGQAEQSVPLAGINLSTNALFSDDQATVVTISPSPADAVLPACEAWVEASDFLPSYISSYIVFSGNQFRLAEAARANIVDVSRVVTIRCGGTVASASFTINAPRR